MAFIWNKNFLKEKTSTGISLGWNCCTTSIGVKQGLRGLKKDGYKTCPFDLMVSNYEGVIQCLYDDFKDFTNPECLKLFPSPDGEEIIIRNIKYKFCHNHESPGHANLHIIQNWEGGKTHFVDNNYEKLIERLNQRVQNFRNYMNSGNHINFLISDFDPDVPELHKCLKTVYPNLKYSLVYYGLEVRSDESSKDYFNRHMIGLNVTRLYT